MRLIYSVMSIIEEKSAKKSVAKDTPGLLSTQRIEVTIGDTKFENIPASAYDTIVQIVREILKGEMSVVDVVDALVNDPAIQEKGEAYTNKLRDVLNAINSKFGKIAINKITHDFPFLAAEGEESYPIAELSRSSQDLLNYEPGLAGRGEIAIALLFGISDFEEAGADDEDSKKAVKSYDLVYKGKKCDVKDLRYLSSKTGKFAANPIVRLGVPAGTAIVKLADEKLEKHAASKYRKIKATDFASQEIGINAIVDAYKKYIQTLDDDEKASLSVPTMAADLESWISEIVEILDEATLEILNKDYPGGFFTITMTEIRRELPPEFGFHTFKSGRVNITDGDRRTLYKGLTKNIPKYTDDLGKLLPAYTGAGAKAPGGDAKPAADAMPPDSENQIAEAVLRRLIRLI